MNNAPHHTSKIITPMLYGNLNLINKKQLINFIIIPENNIRLTVIIMDGYKMKIKCDSCGRKEAIVYQPHTGKRLCKHCFINDIKQRVRMEVEKNKLFSSNDTLLLALSGGKDSFVLLDIMPHIHPPSKLIGLSIIEGIPNYNRKEDVTKMIKYARDRGVDIIITSFKEFIGYGLGEIVLKARKNGVLVSPCTFCGGLRRRIINVYAREVGATKTVTAHNLDDEVQTLFMNFLRGDPERLIRQHPRAPRLSEKFVHKVKPLRSIYEWEATMYAYLLGFRFQETECMFITQQPTLRARIRRWLYQLERSHPGTMLRLLKLFDELVEQHTMQAWNLPSLPHCKYCGEPTSFGRDVCKLCELLLKSGIKPSYTPRITLPEKVIEASIPD